MKKKLFTLVLGCMISTQACSFAMSTSSFDQGMAKGIDYFNRGLYYEARDEFQWFCDYNWGKMNAEQQKYALDYLDGAKQKIQGWEAIAYINTDIFRYLGKSKTWLSQNFGGLYARYDVGEGGYGYVYNNSPYCYIMPYFEDYCNGFLVSLDQFIINSAWSYSKAEIERVLNCHVERFDDYYEDGTSGYCFTYNNCFIMISSGDTVYGWDGRVYSDYDVRIFSELENNITL